MNRDYWQTLYNAYLQHVGHRPEGAAYLASYAVQHDTTYNRDRLRLTQNEDGTWSRIEEVQNG